MRSRSRFPDVVPDVDEPTLREIYGSNADAVIAFGRFLRLPRDERGCVVCPDHWHAWATGNLTAREVLAIDDLRAAA